jgi:hypothetical protein
MASVVLATLAWACALYPESPVRALTYAPTDAVLKQVVVIPFYAHRTFEFDRLRGGVPEKLAQERMTRAVRIAFAEQGIDLVPEEVVDRAMTDVTRLTPAVDARIFAEIAAREFGATGILLGEVLRYRDVSGASTAARRPASVAFQLSLYDVPNGEKVWAARFDETQSVVEPDLVRNPDDVTPPDPFLSADDIARRGAAALAEALASTR